MPYKFLMYEEREAVAILTLNRPEKRNALSAALRQEIVNCLEELGKNDKVKVAVLTGAGASFCAGFDLKEFETGDIKTILANAVAYHRKVYTFSKPLVAAVNGPALAGGMDLAVMCDIRIASKKATFGQPQVSMGISALYGLLRTVIPETVTRELCLTGRQINTKEALNLGLVNMVVSGEKLMDEAIMIAQLVAGNKASLATKEQFLKAQPKLFEVAG